MKKLFFILLFLIISGCVANHNSELELSSNDIEISHPYKTLGFGEYIKNPSNVPYTFMNSRILQSNNTSGLRYSLCAEDSTVAMNLFNLYIEDANYDPHVLDNPDASEEQKQKRRSQGYGTWHLVDNWKAKTHYHFVIATAGENWWKHVILEDCRYFSASKENRWGGGHQKKIDVQGSRFGNDFSVMIGVLGEEHRSANDFLEFLKYYYGRGKIVIADNILHDVSINNDSKSVNITSKIVLKHWQDWGIPTIYTYHNLSHSLNIDSGNITITSKRRVSSSEGKINYSLLSS